jgi:hypothetical protein
VRSLPVYLWGPAIVFFFLLHLPFPAATTLAGAPDTPRHGMRRRSTETKTSLRPAATNPQCQKGSCHLGKSSIRFDTMQCITVYHSFPSNTDSTDNIQSYTLNGRRQNLPWNYSRLSSTTIQSPLQPQPQQRATTNPQRIAVVVSRGQAIDADPVSDGRSTVQARSRSRPEGNQGQGCRVGVPPVPVIS